MFSLIFKSLKRLISFIFGCFSKKKPEVKGKASFAPPPKPSGFVTQVPRRRETAAQRNLRRKESKQKQKAFSSEFDEIFSSIQPLPEVTVVPPSPVLSEVKQNIADGGCTQTCVYQKKLLAHEIEELPPFGHDCANFVGFAKSDDLTVKVQDLGGRVTITHPDYPSHWKQFSIRRFNRWVDFKSNDAKKSSIWSRVPHAKAFLNIRDNSVAAKPIPSAFLQSYCGKRGISYDQMKALINGIWNSDIIKVTSAVDAVRVYEQALLAKQYNILNDEQLGLPAPTWFLSDSESDRKAAEQLFKASDSIKKARASSSKLQKQLAFSKVNRKLEQQFQNEEDLL